MAVSNLEYFRTFFVTANVLSFTKAAEQLYLTQPAVSQSIKKLEKDLGVPLFIRSSRGLSLTNEGEIMFQHVQKAFFNLQAGENHIHDLSKYQIEELDIAASETSLRFYLAPRFERFKKEYPNAIVTIFDSTDQEAYLKLESSEVIAAFLVSPIPEDFAFYLTPIRDVQDVFVASRDFPINSEKAYNISDLVSYPLIGVSEENSFRDYINTWFLNENVIFTPAFTVNRFGDMLPLIENGLGIGILPYDYAKERIRSGELIQIKTDSPIPPRTMYLVLNVSRPISTLNEHILQLFLDKELKIQ